MKLHVPRLQPSKVLAGFGVLDLKKVELVRTMDNDRLSRVVRGDCYRIVVGFRAIIASIQLSVYEAIFHENGLRATVCVYDGPKCVVISQSDCPVKSIGHVQFSSRDRSVEVRPLAGGHIQSR